MKYVFGMLKYDTSDPWLIDLQNYLDFHLSFILRYTKNRMKWAESVCITDIIQNMEDIDAVPHIGNNRPIQRTFEYAGNGYYKAIFLRSKDNDRMDITYIKNLTELTFNGKTENIPSAEDFKRHGKW